MHACALPSKLIGVLIWAKKGEEISSQIQHPLSSCDRCQKILAFAIALYFQQLRGKTHTSLSELLSPTTQWNRSPRITFFIFRFTHIPEVEASQASPLEFQRCTDFLYRDKAACQSENGGTAVFLRLKDHVTIVRSEI